MGILVSLGRRGYTERHAPVRLLPTFADSHFDMGAAQWYSLRGSARSVLECLGVVCHRVYRSAPLEVSSTPWHAEVRLARLLEPQVVVSGTHQCDFANYCRQQCTFRRLASK